MAQASNAMLAINSLDRYIVGGHSGPNTTANALFAEYLNYPPYCNDFQIQSPGALLYGYMTKLIVSQVQLQYNIPTVVPGKNDQFFIQDANTAIKYLITIPYGFYTPIELAAVLQIAILQSDIVFLAPLFTVTYNNINGNIGGFLFQGNDGFRFNFPSLEELDLQQAIISLKAYKLIGMNIFNVQPATQQESKSALTWLYTQYIDITSETLTKYQNIKDSDTSAQKLNSIIARIYLSGVGVPNQLGNSVLGSAPFIVVQDLNSPKIIRWNRDEAINSLDFQLRDMYGDLIFISNYANNAFEQTFYNTEFQMTLLCIEGERH